MSIRILIPALLTALMINYAAAQTIALDMDTASGIQATASGRDTAQLVTVQVRIAGAVTLFSYQYKVAFDTSKLLYVSSQLDGSPLGEKNILTRNGGAPIGVCQQQLNPPAADTIEISGTITGTDPARSVSGDGLIGVVYFKSKTAFNDSTVIAASGGYTAMCGGDFAPVSAYAAGKYRVVPSVAAAPDRFTAERFGGVADFRTINVAIGNSCASFNIPFVAAEGTSLTFRLFTAGGKHIATRSVPFTAANRQLSVPFSRIASTLCAGVYIGSIETDGRIVSQTIRIQ